MKYISVTIVQNIIKHDCAMIMSLWKQSLSCITAVLGRAFHPWSFKNGGETVWQHNFQQLHTDTNDSVMRFYFFLGDTYLKSWMTEFFEDFFSVR